MKQIIFFFLVLMTAPLLAGCNNVTRELREFRDFFNPPVNTILYNQSIIDDLVMQAQGDITLSTPIGLGVLYPTNLLPTEETPPFGKVAIDQMGTRMVQLGYTVRELGVPLPAALKMPEAIWLERARANNIPFIITGNYTISEYDIMVNTRMVRLSDGTIVAASDYRIPLGSDTYRLIGRDPFYAVPEAPRNNPDAKVVGKPLPKQVMPQPIISRPPISKPIISNKPYNN